jgi:hypothetical protein
MSFRASKVSGIGCRSSTGTPFTVAQSRRGETVNEELKRFDVTLTRDGTTERKTSFTWGRDYDHAYARMAEEFERNSLWQGWSFKVASQPTNDEGPDLPEEPEALWKLLADVLTALYQKGECPQLEEGGDWRVKAAEYNPGIRRTAGDGEWSRMVEWTNASGKWRWDVTGNTTR